MRGTCNAYCVLMCLCMCVIVCVRFSERERDFKIVRGCVRERMKEREGGGGGREGGIKTIKPKLETVKCEEIFRDGQYSTLILSSSYQVVHYLHGLCLCLCLYLFLCLCLPCSLN